MSDIDEEEEWKGIDVDEPAKVPEPTATKQAPSGEEVRQIQEASELYKSSSFKLQIDALLPNVRPKSTNFSALEEFLFSLRDFLQSIPTSAPKHPLTASKELEQKGVSVPYPLPPPTENAKWTVAFQPPTDVTIVGSWPNGLSVKAKNDMPWVIDVAVDMPSALFQEKDYLDGRFSHRKAFFLAWIASAIRAKKKTFDCDILYEASSGDNRRTSALLVPKKGGKLTELADLQLFVRLIAVLPAQHPIAMNRLAPSQSNLRLQKIDGEVISQPSPNYNHSILMCTMARPQLIAAHSILQEVPGYRDALTLTRVWAIQRAYYAAAEGEKRVVGFEGRGTWWQALLTFLIYGNEPTPGLPSTKRTQLGRGLSSYQLFRSALGFLSTHNFEKELVFMKSKNRHKFSPEEYKSHYEAVFVDPSSTVNLLQGVPLVSLEMLRHDAQMSLDVLNDNLNADPFAPIFLEDRRKLFDRFDTVLRVDLTRAKLRQSSGHDIADLGSASALVVRTLCTVLRQALGDRVRAIGVFSTQNSYRPLTDAAPTPHSEIFIGLILDTQKAFRLVDYGPPPASEDPADDSSEFRQLWGEKADVRRFRDGRVLESVVWEVKEADDRFDIPILIVRHILKRHLGLGAVQDVELRQIAVRDIIRVPTKLSAILMSKSGQAGFQKAIEAFDGVVKRIKGLDEEIPLAVLSAQPISPALRYTNVFVPFALPMQALSSFPRTAHYVPIIDFIIQFERSARWPDDLAAIQKMKLAFMERLASALMTSAEGFDVSVVYEHLTPSLDVPDNAVLQITTAAGWAFSARIYHDRELTLLNRAAEQKGSNATKPTDASVSRRNLSQTILSYRRHFIYKPAHHRAVAALCHQHSAYAGTVRLVKRWLSSHWLLNCHISEEAVELLCAHLFIGRYADGSVQTRHEPASVPGSKELGFIRMVKFFRDWRWQNGINIPMYRQSLKENEEVLSQDGGASVGSLHCAWRLSTELDQDGHMWTSTGPKILAAQRVKALAKATWSVLQGLEVGQINSKSLFVHPTGEYDFVIRLHTPVLNRYFQNVVSGPDFWLEGSVAKAGEGSHAIRVGFDPVWSLVQDLRLAFEDVLELFYDQFGGDSIGALWHPSVTKVRPFRVLAGYSTIPCEADAKVNHSNLVDLNRASIYAEIQKMGEGLIRAIEVQK